MSRRLPAPSAETKKAQLALALGDEPVFVPAPLEAKTVPPGQVEVLPPAHEVWSPASAPAEEDPYAPTDGQQEHEYLRLEAAKYEDRWFRAVTTFCAAAFLTVSAKAGIKITEIILAKYGIPPVPTKICGMPLLESTSMTRAN